MGVYKSKMLGIKRLAVITLFIATPSVYAAKWIEVGDLHLRSDIQLLADVGVIKVPVTTYPLMWSGVIKDIEKTNPQDLTPEIKAAYERVEGAYQRSHLRSGGELTVSARTDEQQFQNYNASPRGQFNSSMSYQGEYEHFEYKVQANYQLENAQQKSENYDYDEFSLDHSYIMGTLGNWAFVAGAYQQWFGPGWDSSLILSNNADPMPTVSILRQSPDAFDLPVLKWLGPWTLTTGVSWMDDDREINDALLWAFRFSFKPVSNFEFGFSRTSQLCGDGRSCDWGTWGDMLVGDDNQMDEDQPGNQLATVDLRWGDTAWGVPYGIYWQSMGEDSFSPERFPPFQEMSYLYGADVSYELMNQSITNFIEYSETEPNCGDDLGDCAYEHHIYKSGYRYKARSLGSTYDNDAHTYTLGFIGRNNQNTQNWFVALRYLELNRDDSNKNDPGGNTVSASAEDIFQMEMTYQMPFWVGELETGLIYNNISPKHGNSDETLDVWAQWQYQF